MGAMTRAGIVTAATWTIYLVVAPALIFGWGVPRLGIVGIAYGELIALAVGIGIFARDLAGGRYGARIARPEPSRTRLWQILRIGLPGSGMAVFTNVGVAVVTSYVGAYGTTALAGFGIGTRLDYIQMFIATGMGPALVAMVGANRGAGHYDRAERTAWIGCLAIAVPTGLIGLAASVMPRLWLLAFDAPPPVIDVAESYLQTLAPTYAFLGLSWGLHFASQGMGRPRWPFIAALVRVGVSVSAGGLIVHSWGMDLRALLFTIAAAQLAATTVVFAAVRRGAWK